MQGQCGMKTQNNVHKLFFRNIRHIDQPFLTMNKAETFIKVHLKLVKMTSRILPDVRQMLNISSLIDDQRLFMNTARTQSCTVFYKGEQGFLCRVKTLIHVYLSNQTKHNEIQLYINSTTCKCLYMQKLIQLHMQMWDKDSLYNLDWGQSKLVSQESFCA